MAHAASAPSIGLREGRVTSWLKWLTGQCAPSVVSYRAGFVCAAVAVVIGFTHPIAMSATEVLLGVMAFCWLLAGGYGERIRAIRANPIALIALAMLALMSVSILYGEAPWSESIVVLAKYRNLFYLVLIVSIFRNDLLREMGLWAFHAAMTVTLIASYLTAAGMPVYKGQSAASAVNAVVFRNYIEHSLCMGLFAYMMAHHFMDFPRWRWITGPLVLAATWNVFGMLYSRTGYLVLVALIVLFCFQRMRFRGLLYAAVVSSLLLVTAYCTPGAFSRRVQVTVDNVGAYLEYRLYGGPESLESRDRLVTDTSSGHRLEWYRFGMKLFAEHPMLGVGVGNQKYHIEAVAEETGVEPVHNLHSEYMMLLVQNGLIGLGALVALFFFQWRCSRDLSPRMRYLAQGALTAIVVGGVFIAFLSQRTQGVMYVFCTGVAMAEYSESMLRRTTAASCEDQRRVIAKTRQRATPVKAA